MTEALEDFITRRRLDALRHNDPLSTARDLSEAIYEAFDYEPGIT